MARYVMNTTILPNDGIFHLREITENEALEWLQRDFISAVGHEGTAKVMSQLLGIEIPNNRIMVQFDVDDEALVFKLDTRLPEGKVLSAEELENLPYK